MVNSKKPIANRIVPPNKLIPILTGTALLLMLMSGVLVRCGSEWDKAEAPPGHKWDHRAGKWEKR